MTVSGSVERNLVKRHFVTVPEGAKALQVNLSGTAADSQTRFIAFTPYGVPVEDTATTQCYLNFSDTAACNPTSRAYPDPIPGVWEIIVESRRTSPTLDNPYTLTTAAQGVTVSPATQTVTATTGVPVPLSWNVTNSFGAVTVTPTGGSLGSSATHRPTIGQGDVQEFTVTVPAGATRLDVAIGNTADPAADLDLYVLKGSTVVGQSADGDSDESVTLTNPTAGVYTIEVDGYDIPSGSTAFDYRDAFSAPGLGSLSVTGGAVVLATGETVGLTGSLTANATAGCGSPAVRRDAAPDRRGCVAGHRNGARRPLTAQRRVAPVTIQRSVRTRIHIRVPRTDMKAVKASHSQMTASTCPRVLPPSSSQSPAAFTARMTGR